MQEKQTTDAIEIQQDQEYTYIRITIIKQPRTFSATVLSHFRRGLEQQKRLRDPFEVWHRCQRSYASITVPTTDPASLALEHNADHTNQPRLRIRRLTRLARSTQSSASVGHLRMTTLSPGHRRCCQRWAPENIWRESATGRTTGKTWHRTTRHRLSSLQHTAFACMLDLQLIHHSHLVPSKMLLLSVKKEYRDKVS